MSDFTVRMPAMGEGIIEAKLVRWLKREGERVEKDEPLVEVATDKVDSEIPSPFAGVVGELLAREGDQVPINAPLARLVSGDGKAAGAPAPTAKPSQQPMVKASSATASSASFQASGNEGYSSQPKSSPLVRKIAKDQQIDLRSVSGSGLGGRITKADVHAYLAVQTTEQTTGQRSDETPSASSSHAPATKTPSRPASAPHSSAVSAALATELRGNDEFLDGVKVRREPMSSMRQLIAEHMLRSVTVSPHVTTTFEINLHKVNRARERHKDEFQRREGFALTFTTFFVYAAAQALKSHPIINVSVDGNDILYKSEINIGVAVALGSGLIVPVIKQAGELNLLGIARRLNDIVYRARNKKLKPDDVRGGTFSITNPGGYGCLHSNPIINQPQAAIMSIGCITKRPVVIEEDAIAVRPMMIAGLTFDHRVIDGETGAKFLASFRDLLEGFDEIPL